MRRVLKRLTPPLSFRKPRHNNNLGFATIEFMVAVMLSFLLLVMVSNLILIQYGRGIVRAAVDEGARAGARYQVDSVGICKQRADSVIATLGEMGKNTSVDCAVVDGRVQATASAVFDGWLPSVPSYTEKATAFAGIPEAPQ